LAQKLRKLGGKRILPPEIFLVTGREGPLYEGEIERAKDWANSILAEVKNQPGLEITGNQLTDMI
jgi:hypothetical protein